MKHICKNEVIVSTTFEDEYIKLSDKNLKFILQISFEDLEAVYKKIKYLKKTEERFI